jgi:hypothetical protein
MSYNVNMHNGGGNSGYGMAAHGGGGGGVGIPGEDIKSRNQLNAIIESQNQKRDESKLKSTVCVHWMAD